MGSIDSRDEDGQYPEYNTMGSLWERTVPPETAAGEDTASTAMPSTEVHSAIPRLPPMTRDEIRTVVLHDKLRRQLLLLGTDTWIEGEEEEEEAERPHTSNSTTNRRPSTTSPYTSATRIQSARPDRPGTWASSLRRADHRQSRGKAAQGLEPPGTSSERAIDNSDNSHLSLKELEKVDRLLRPTAATRAREMEATARRDLPVFSLQNLLSGQRRVRPRLSVLDEEEFTDRFKGTKKLDRGGLETMITRLSSYNRDEASDIRRKSHEMKQQLGIFGIYHNGVKNTQQTESRTHLEQRVRELQLRQTRKINMKSPM